MFPYCDPWAKFTAVNEKSNEFWTANLASPFCVLKVTTYIPDWRTRLSTVPVMFVLELTVQIPCFTSSIQISQGVEEVRPDPTASS